MSAPTSLLLTCLILTLVPILSTQLPRYLAHRRHIRAEANRPSMLDSSDTDKKPYASSSSSKRPWDPPFPTTHARNGSGWRILPPSEPRASDGSVEDVECDVIPEMVAHTSPIRTPRVQYSNEEQATRDDVVEKNKPGAMSIVWTVIAILAGIFFVLLFAILIAHCLAWFIVYKTEARLGEARRGLVQGGEMRLCLCARG
jgi:hypothetical protein